MSVIIGTIGSAHGVRGWLKISSFTENIESIFDYQPWFIWKSRRKTLIRLESWKRHYRKLVVKIVGINDRDSACMLTNNEIMVNRHYFPKLEKGYYYWKDLLGCQVVNTNGHNLGKIISMLKTRSNDIMIIKPNADNTFEMSKRLIPFLDKQVVKKVDLTAKLVLVNWDNI